MPARMRVFVVVTWPFSRAMPLVGIFFSRSLASSSSPGSSSPTTPTGKHFHAQRSQVHDGVAAAAGNDGTFAMLQDEHRRLARDARNFAKNEFVGHQIGQHGDGDVWQMTERSSSSARILSVAWSWNQIRHSGAQSAVAERSETSHSLTRFSLRRRSKPCSSSSGDVPSSPGRRLRCTLELHVAPAPREPVATRPASPPRLTASFSVVTKAVAPACLPQTQQRLVRRPRCTHDDRETRACPRRSNSRLAQFGEEVLRPSDAAECETRVVGLRRNDAARYSPHDTGPRALEVDRQPRHPSKRSRRLVTATTAARAIVRRAAANRADRAP